MESTTKDIHQVLGNLRRRVDELSKGDYSKGYKNELLEVEENINHFAPDTIIKFISPLIQQLNDISEDVYQKVSDDPHEEINKLVDQGIEVDDIQFRNPTGESKRDLMRKEVSNYIENLRYYLKKYQPIHTGNDFSISDSSSVKIITIDYKEFDAKGNDKLRDLHNSLRNYIDHISFRDFEKVFSKKDLIISTPINWNKTKSSFRYFLKRLFKHNDIESNGDINWIAVNNCFRFHGEVIDQKKIKGHSHDPVNTQELDRIVSNL